MVVAEWGGRARTRRRAFNALNPLQKGKISKRCKGVQSAKITCAEMQLFFENCRPKEPMKGCP